jgi:hypothetical protein
MQPDQNPRIIGLDVERFFPPGERLGKRAGIFFANAYARPAETVEGVDVGTRVDDADIFAPATAAASQTALREPLAGGDKAHMY